MALLEMITLIVAAILVKYTLDIIYNLTYHPLSTFPGPRLWAASRIPYTLFLASGRLAQKTHALHQGYGPIVRLAPNELSFIEGQAWHDIYNYRPGKPNFPKNPLWMAPAENGIHSILSANDADHSRYRRLLAHAFSEKALIGQEDLLLLYIRLLTGRLRAIASCSPEESPQEKAEGEKGPTGAAAAGVVDLTQWLNFTTFDIIGDLSLGESFGCLETGKYHEWVSILFQSFKAAAVFICLRFYRLDGLVKRLLPRSILQRRERHAQMANSRIHKRIAAQDEKVNGDAYPRKSDFMAYILRHNDEKGMSELEIEQTMRILVAVGSETTATALTGILRNLVQNPEVLRRLQGEIRDAFREMSEITALSVAKLAYLSAVIEEGLRLCPPVPLGMPRLVPEGGAEVAGHALPAGTFVSCSGYASNRSPLNFPDQPTKFDPSRWMAPTNDAQKAAATTTTTTAKSAFNPFSLGPRSCLGRNLAYLEMRLILVHLLFVFDFHVPEDQKDDTGSSKSGHGSGSAAEISCLKPWEDQNSWILWEKAPLMVRLSVRDGVR